MPNPWGEVLLNKTPHPWIVRALDSLDVLLLDHAHCEKKAAMTATEVAVNIAGELRILKWT